MKAWDGVDPAHGSRKRATLAVGGDSEIDSDATGSSDNCSSTGGAIPKSQYLAHELAIIYARTGISMADSSLYWTRKYDVDC